jgi:hypothetical protein
VQAIIIKFYRIDLLQKYKNPSPALPETHRSKISSPRFGGIEGVNSNESKRSNGSLMNYQ